MAEQKSGSGEDEMSRSYDVIVVGARCGGAPTAMLLARQGHRVLLADRATFPSDTLSTHVMQPLAAAALARWGLLDRLVATGCPPINTYAYDFGGLTLEGAPGTEDAPFAYCPRRIVLDKLLVDAAAEAGAEVREGFAVERVLIEGGRVVGVEGRLGDGPMIGERAQVIVGADGRNSIVAKAVAADRYNEKPPILAIFYAYWSGLPMHGRFETYALPHCGFAVAETHDSLTVTVGGWPCGRFDRQSRDVEAAFLEMLAMAPAFHERVSAANRQTRFVGAPTPNFFRKPYGAGWALVGDAGYLKDPVTAQGILDSFRDAELCAAALGEMLRGERSFEAAMDAYHRARDSAALAMYDFTCDMALMEPPPPEMQLLLNSMRGNQEAMNGFAKANAGTISPAVFFSPDNTARIVATG